MQRLIIPAALESLSAVSAFAQEAAVAAGLDQRAAYQLRLALVELVTNTITHGYGAANQPGTVELQAEAGERTLTVTLEDTACPYDPSQAPLPQDLVAPAEERKMGGLGVFLALSALDSFHYDRIGNRNRSVLTMTRTAANQAD